MMLAAPLLVRIGLFAVAGLSLGTANFLALRRNTELYLAGDGRGRAVAIHALRLALLVGAWLVVARFGAAAILSAFAGFVASRFVVTAHAARAS